MKIRRLVKIPQNMSFFLFGPRQTGKSLLIKNHLAEQNHWSVNLLINKVFLRFNREPSLFYSEAKFQIEQNQVRVIFVDEIQKIPMLLDEIHTLIEEYPVRFILTGSSARKLKRIHANLLGGRSLVFKMFPFTYCELQTKFNLSVALQFGLIPGIYFTKKDLIRKQLTAYVMTYMKEEIAAEGFVRNLGNFHRFLDVAAQYTAEILNYDNISREASVPAKTVKGYFEILVDTLIGFQLPAWELSVKKQLAKHPKFYLFDNGITSALAQTLSGSLGPEVRGKRFEQFLINEIRALIDYEDLEFNLHYWRTSAGNEVDLIISRQNKPIAAIEIKAKKKLLSKDFSGLHSFNEEFPGVPFLAIVSEVDTPYLEGKILVTPWKHFLDKQLQLIFKFQ